MEEELLKNMGILKSGKQNLPYELAELKKQINNLVKANVNLMNEVKSHKSNAYFLCEFIRKNIETDNYMINNLLKKYERKDYEINQVKKRASLY